MKKCALLAILALAVVAIVVWKIYGKDIMAAAKNR